MNSRFPQIIGLECPRPGMAVFHRIFCEVSVFHAVTVAPPLGRSRRHWVRETRASWFAPGLALQELARYRE